MTCGEVWKKLVNSKATGDDVLDTSGWGTMERSPLGAIVGHDHDSNGTDSKGQGLSKVGNVKAILAIAALVAKMPTAVPTARVRNVCIRSNQKSRR